MVRTTLAGIRDHLPRLVAVSLAVLLAVAFLSATLLLNSSMRATLRHSVGQSYAAADLVVSASTTADESLTDSDVELVAGTAGVSEAFADRSVTAVATTSQGQQYLLVSELAPEDFRTTSLAEGATPSSASEVAVTTSTASLYDLSLGSQVSLEGVSEGGAGTGAATVSVTVSGILTDSNDPSALAGSGFFGTAALLDALEPEGTTAPSDIQVAVDPGVSVADVQASLQATLDGDVIVQTPDEKVNDRIAGLTGGTDMLTVVLLVFVGIALLVSGMVIANTFAVLVSQRTRELALLRCVGATRTQVKRSVLLEAGVVGLGASVLGVAAASGLMAGLVAVRNAVEGSDLAVFGMSWSAVVWPIVVGTVLTMIAASGPARMATRVAPLAALRPVEAPSASTRSGRARLVVGILLTVVGAMILVGSSLLPLLLNGDSGTGASSLTTFGLAFLGSALSAVGVIMLAVFYVPGLIRLIGRVVNRGSAVTGRLATLNSVRNPRRTAATATALLVGVTLVTTILTAGQVARSTLFSTLDAYSPIDFTVTLPEGDGNAVTSVASSLEAIDGVSAVASMEVAQLSLAEGSAEEGGSASLENVWEVVAIDPADYAAVSRVAGAGLAEGTALVPETKGSSVTLTGTEGSATLAAKEKGASYGEAIVTPSDFASIAGETGATEDAVAVRAADDLSLSQLQDLQKAILEAVPNASVDSPALERSMYGQIIDTLLLIVTGLLAVAVVIALIGVGNTLSLSIIERTRENALLRALGLTRRQLRRMLAIEALYLAGVAALLGALLGVGYGILGAMSLLVGLGTVAVSVPWWQLVAVVAVAAAAGLLASVGPSRRAARLSPIAGLAVE